jgi:hypothetical protein
VRPLQTRFPSGSPALALVNLCLRTAADAPVRRRRDDDVLAGSFYKRHAISPCSLLREWPLAACEDAVSGSLSSPLRGAFHLSLTVLVHYRSLKVGSLGGWSPQLPTRFHVPRGTQDADPSPPLSATGLSPSVILLSSSFAFASVRWCRSYNPRRIETRLVWARPGSLATTTGLSLDFSSSGY